VQTHKVSGFPIVLLGGDYWDGLLTWLRGTVHEHGMIAAADVDLLQIASTAEEAVDVVVRRNAEIRAEEAAAAQAAERAVRDAQAAGDGLATGGTSGEPVDESLAGGGW
jgi:hypothetical protein